MYQIANINNKNKIKINLASYCLHQFVEIDLRDTNKDSQKYNKLHNACQFDMTYM